MVSVFHVTLLMGIVGLCSFPVAFAESRLCNATLMAHLDRCQSLVNTDWYIAFDFTYALSTSQWHWLLWNSTLKFIAIDFIKTLAVEQDRTQFRFSLVSMDRNDFSVLNNICNNERPLPAMVDNLQQPRYDQTGTDRSSLIFNIVNLQLTQCARPNSWKTVVVFSYGLAASSEVPYIRAQVRYWKILYGSRIQVFVLSATMPGSQIHNSFRDLHPDDIDEVFYFNTSTGHETGDQLNNLVYDAANFARRCACHISGGCRYIERHQLCNFTPEQSGTMRCSKVVLHESAPSNVPECFQSLRYEENCPVERCQECTQNWSPWSACEFSRTLYIARQGRRRNPTCSLVEWKYCGFVSSNETVFPPIDYPTRARSTYKTTEPSRDLPNGDAETNDVRLIILIVVSIGSIVVLCCTAYVLYQMYKRGPRATFTTIFASLLKPVTVSNESINPSISLLTLGTAENVLLGQTEPSRSKTQPLIPQHHKRHISHGRCTEKTGSVFKKRHASVPTDKVHKHHSHQKQQVKISLHSKKHSSHVNPLNRQKSKQSTFKSKTGIL